MSEEQRFSGRVFGVATVTFTDPDGHRFVRDVVRHPGAVTIVPVHDDGRATLVRQLRVAVGETVLEAPAGTCDVQGEDPATAARRELEEEAGLRAGQWRELGEVYNSPGYSDERTIVYLATGLEACDTNPAGAEERWMSTERAALSDVERLVAEGRLRDATTIMAMLLARSALGGSPAG